MARSKIPGPLERRHLVEGKLGAVQAMRYAEAYLAEGRSVEAIDFLRHAEATDRLQDLRREAVASGDLFLLRASAAAMEAQPERDEWLALAEAAAAAGKDRYAAEARRQAERGED
jgi:hypothetical protein